MAAMGGNVKGLAAEINVTPMIDVLLVLLIIFMVIVPAVPRGESALIPTSGKSTTGDAVVLEVLKGSANSVELRINQRPVAEGELQSRLAAVYANRATRVLFIRGDDGLPFTEIAKVVDISHAAGVDQIGLMTPGNAVGR